LPHFSFLNVFLFAAPVIIVDFPNLFINKKKCVKTVYITTWAVIGAANTAAPLYSKY
jgi:hypothetical protein